MAFPVSPTNGQTATVNGITYVYSSTYRSWTRTSSSLSSLPSLYIVGNVNAGNVTANSGTVSTSTTTGALVVTGGVGVSGALYIANTGDVSANLGTVRTNLNTLDANVGAYGIYANANLGTATTNITTLFSNAATQATSINSIDANLGTATTNITTLFSNAATQAISITSLATGANANTAAYLPSVTTLAGLTSFGAAAATTTAQGSLTVVGNLTIQGNTLTIGSNNLTVTDSIIDLHTYANLAALVSNDGRDIGIRFHYYKTSDKHAFLGWENATEALTYYQDATETNGVITGTLGNVEIGSLYVSNTTTSSSTTTGALQVRGGVGVGGIINTTGINVVNGLADGGGIKFQSLGFTEYEIDNSSGSLRVFQPGVNRLTLDKSGNLGVANSAPVSNLSVTGTTWTSGNINTGGWIVPTSNVSQNLGTTTNWWGTFYGVSTQAKYADLAENYVGDTEYAPGTVVVFGGAEEVTVTNMTHDTRVAGVVSTNPAYLMNSMNGNVSVAMTGRVPCCVQGPVEKGTVLVSSHIPGVAEALNSSMYRPGCVIGKALEKIDGTHIKTIEVVVGRF